MEDDISPPVVEHVPQQKYLHVAMVLGMSLGRTLIISPSQSGIILDLGLVQEPEASSGGQNERVLPWPAAMSEEVWMAGRIKLETFLREGMNAPVY